MNWNLDDHPLRVDRDACMHACMGLQLVYSAGSAVSNVLHTRYSSAPGLYDTKSGSSLYSLTLTPRRSSHDR